MGFNMTVIENKTQPFKEEIPYQQSSKTTKKFNKGLLIVSTACAILSLIPPLRLAGALALRGTALLSSGVNGMDSWKTEGILGRITQISQVALIILGIIAVATASPVLILASIAADLALQIFEMGRCLNQKEYSKALCHLGIVVIDTLLLAGLIVGSWELMVAALSVQATAMLVFMCAAGAMALENKDNSLLLEATCFAILAGVGVTGALTTAEMRSLTPKNPHFKFKSDSDQPKIILDKNNRIITILESGESTNFQLPKDGYVNVIDYKYGPGMETTVYGDRFINWFSLDPKYFPTLPVGGFAFIPTLFKKLFPSKKAELACR